jgi:hypothetical protein
MGASPHKKSQVRRGKKPFQPAVGTDFGLVEEVEARTRGFLARVIASGCVIGLAVSGCYSLVTGKYMVAVGVWSVVGPFLSALMTYYFGPKRE